MQSCSQVTYAGPDDPSVAVNGTCVDQAGNVSSSSVFALQYDETDPVATASAGRGPDTNGWYNHPVTFSFGASDATSGVEACDVPKTYSGPDTTSTSVTGSCRDRAGNVASPSASLRYDASGPQVDDDPGAGANANGWYNAPARRELRRHRPDVRRRVVRCECDVLGPRQLDGRGHRHLPRQRRKHGLRLARPEVRRDRAATRRHPVPPAERGRLVQRPAHRGLPRHGRYVRDRLLHGRSRATAARTPPQPRSPAPARDNAGNTTARTLAFKYDATAPQVSTTPARQPNGAGLVQRAADRQLRGQRCDCGSRVVRRPRRATRARTARRRESSGRAVDNAGNARHGLARAQVRRYGSAGRDDPGASPERARVGTTRRSRSASPEPTPRPASRSCDPSKTYSGPDSATAAVVGTCRDHAGNSGAGSLRAEVRRDGAAGERDARPPAERGRLVQRAARGQLRGDRRHLRDRLLRRREDVLGARQRYGLGGRILPRPRRQPERVSGASH